MDKLFEFDVEIQRCNGTIANVTMAWPALTRGQRVNVPVNDRDWSSAEVIELVKKVSESEAGTHKVIVREIAPKTT